jgi:glucose dehydrogenase
MDRIKDRLMNRTLRCSSSHFIFSILLTASLTGSAQSNGSNGMTTNIPGELPNIHLVSPVADGQWTMPAGDYGNTRYSPLDKINTTNVQNLHVVATASTGIPHGHEGGPLVV